MSDLQAKRDQLAAKLQILESQLAIQKEREKLNAAKKAIAALKKPTEKQIAAGKKAAEKAKAARTAKKQGKAKTEG